MKSATEVLKVLPNLPAAQVDDPRARKPTDETARIVNTLFDELRSIFPAWKQAWPNDAAEKRAKRTWVKGFMRAGVTTVEQLRYGIEACRLMDTDFAPSVGKFVKLCVPTAADLGIPLDDHAWREVVRNCANPGHHTWSHEAVRLAGSSVGWFNLRCSSIPEETLRKRFDHAYYQLRRRLAMGMPLEEPRQGIEDQSGQLTPEQADRRGEQAVQHLMRVQGLDKISGEEARLQLLQKMRIRRGEVE
ncbi:phage replication protein P [Pseudomonas flavescens]|uniref:Phage replication protein P n=1 Tax=Phytopseudomonas flavescens TaxID=29435 RepID=A0A1G7XQE1_9GAMM|nr:replication protein P [Pseudomonas flavescens]SDG86351.1 phage replication protein P [Pseudomonas flavescens]